jgi:hypothetical protein
VIGSLGNASQVSTTPSATLKAVAVVVKSKLNVVVVTAVIVCSPLGGAGSAPLAFFIPSMTTLSPTTRPCSVVPVVIVTTLALTVAADIVKGNLNTVPVLSSAVVGNLTALPATVNGDTILLIPLRTCHSPLRSSLPFILELRNPLCN